MSASVLKTKSPHFTDEQTALVMEELHSILTSDTFSGSKRCRDFLEFVVDRALASDHESLTERFLGARIFGRSIDYDTASDSIVRVRASDVRRRLIQYYSSRPTPPVRINLVAGGYIPEFHWRQEEPRDSGSPVDLPRSDVPATAPETISDVSAANPRTYGRHIGFAAVALVCLVGIALYAWNRLATDPPKNDVERFWAPILRDHSEVLICLGDTTRFWVSAKLAAAIAQHPQSVSIDPGQFVVTRDDSLTAGNLRSALSIMGLLHQHGIPNQLRWPQEVQALDLDTRNTVFIGAFNNPWTMSLNQNLRFTFEQGGTVEEPVWTIKDHLLNRVWSLTRTDPQPVDHDFAIITRVLDSARKRVVVSVGGLNQFGTEAAGEFVADPAALKEFTRNAPKGWESKNIQIVLEMEVSNQKPVRPRIIASDVW